MKIGIIFFLASAALSACTTHRGNLDDYEVIREGSVPAVRLESFRMCVRDVLHDSRIGVNRETRRDSMTRIEIVGFEVGPILSADVRDDGRYELYEITRLVRNRLDDERARFDACVAKHR